MSNVRHNLYSLRRLPAVAVTRSVCCVMVCVIVLVMGTLAAGQKYEDFITETPLPPSDTLVLGFQGGRQSWDSETEGIRRLALRLREQKLPGVHIETVENHKRGLAIQLIRNAFDRNRDGELDGEERAAVRLIVYGQSFGGAAVVKLARQLEEMDVPVLLTVQIDSIGRGDSEIPPNVRRAANLYQKNGWFVRGEAPIRAQDPEKTAILGNFQFDYNQQGSRKVDLSGVPWHKKIFRLAHSRMNLDPDVWNQVEALILAELAVSRKTSLQVE